MRNHPEILLFCILAAVGCQKDYQAEETDLLTGETSLTVRVAEHLAPTRVYTDLSGTYAWHNYDRICVFDDQDEKLEFQPKSGGPVATFTVPGAHNLGEYAVYPSRDAVSVAGEAVTIDLPSAYDWNIWQNEMPMLGKVDAASHNVSFKALCGVLRLFIYGVPDDATELTLTVPGKKITGRFTIADASVSAPEIQLAESAGDDSSVTISFSVYKSSTMLFIIPLPVGTIDSFTIRFNDANATSRTVTTPFTVARNDLIDAPELNLGPTEGQYVQHPPIADGFLIKGVCTKSSRGPGQSTYSFTYDDDLRLIDVSKTYTCRGRLYGIFHLFTSGLISSYDTAISTIDWDYLDSLSDNDLENWLQNYLTNESAAWLRELLYNYLYYVLGLDYYDCQNLSLDQLWAYRDDVLSDESSSAYQYYRNTLNRWLSEANSCGDVVETSRYTYYKYGKNQIEWRDYLFSLYRNIAWYHSDRDDYILTYHSDGTLATVSEDMQGGYHAFFFWENGNLVSIEEENFSGSRTPDNPEHNYYRFAYSQDEYIWGGISVNAMVMELAVPEFNDQLSRLQTRNIPSEYSSPGYHRSFSHVLDQEGRLVEMKAKHFSHGIEGNTITYTFSY